MACHIPVIIEENYLAVMNWIGNHQKEKEESHFISLSNLNKLRRIFAVSLAPTTRRIVSCLCPGIMGVSLVI